MKHVILIRSITYSESYLSQVVNLLLKAVNPNGPPPRAKGSVPCTQTDVTFQDPGRFVCLFQSVDSFDVIWFGAGGGVKFELAFHVRDTGTGLDLNGFYVEAEGFWDWN